MKIKIMPAGTVLRKAPGQGERATLKVPEGAAWGRGEATGRGSGWAVGVGPFPPGVGCLEGRARPNMGVGVNRPINHQMRSTESLKSLVSSIGSHQEQLL